MQVGSAPPLPRLKIGSLLPGYPLSTPLTFQAKIRAVTALLNGVTASYLSCRNYVSDLLIHGVLPAFNVSDLLIHVKEEVEQNQEHRRSKRAAVCAAPVCAAPAVVWYEPPQPEG